MKPNELTRRGFDTIDDLLAAYDAAVRDIDVLRAMWSACEICRHKDDCTKPDAGPCEDCGECWCDGCNVHNNNAKFEWRGAVCG